MRFKEIIEAKEDPYYWQAKPTDPYKPSYQDRNMYGVTIRDPGANIDKVAPEIEAIKGKDGIYDLARMTNQFVQDLMRKYPKTFFGDFYEPTAKGGDYAAYSKYTEENKKRIIDDLTFHNKWVHNDSRFFYPNRPYDTDALQGFRGDERTGQVENTAKKFDPKDMQFYLNAYKWALGKRLVDPVPAEQWAMIALVEGRDDFGFNIGNWTKEVAKNPTSAQKDKQLLDMGLVNEYQRSFVGVLIQKQAIVKKTGMNFYQAWNGGTQNVGRYQAQAKAVKDPRNKPLLDAIASML
jgi:hypothetical protein